MSRSNVGNPRTYEAGDMRDSKSTSQTNREMAKREEKKNAHLDKDSSMFLNFTSYQFLQR
jgi:hypothetical protein